VDRFHQQNPLAPGISKEELRKDVAPAAPLEVFRAAFEDLAKERKLVITGDLVARAGWTITLSAEETRARDQIERAFARAGLAVPAVKEVLARLPVEPKHAQKILHLLIREQILVKVTEDLIFHRDAIAKLKALLTDYKKQKGDRLSVPVFKEMTGISRKYAIPLLEYLDRAGITRRTPTDRLIL
jgi:selenocysteine-specific elongation factor